jgi:hypothetical protein
VVLHYIGWFQGLGCSEDWKLANVSPIFKKGDKSKPANYRPVSLTSVCCKVIEHIIHSHLMKFFEDQESS